MMITANSKLPVHTNKADLFTITTNNIIFAICAATTITTTSITATQLLLYLRLLVLVTVTLTLPQILQLLLPVVLLVVVLP